MRESSQDFWAERACHLVFRYDNLEEKRQNHERNNEGSEQKEKEKQEKFVIDNETAQAQPSRSTLSANVSKNHHMDVLEVMLWFG